MLQQRVLQAYQKSEALKYSLRMFHSTPDCQALRFFISSLPTGVTLFKSEEIEVYQTVPVNTGGAFCDLLCGRHATLGKVALKRLRTDASGSSRLPVRPIICVCSLFA